MQPQFTPEELESLSAELEPLAANAVSEYLDRKGIDARSDITLASTEAYSHNPSGVIGLHIETHLIICFAPDNIPRGQPNSDVKKMARHIISECGLESVIAEAAANDQILPDPGGSRDHGDDAQ